MDDNTIGTEDLYFILQNAMLERDGFKIHHRKDGFTAGELYNLAGQNDVVVSLTFIGDSKWAKLYNDSGLTGVFVYTLNERKSLEIDNTSLDGLNLVKFQNVHQPNMPILEINPHEIFTVMTAPNIYPENTFTSREKRSIHSIKIPFEPKGHGKDIVWTYTALTQFMDNGIALTPEEHSLYLAFKLILDSDHFTDAERREIYNNDGKIANPEVIYHYLMWKKDAGILKNNDQYNLNILKNSRLSAKLQILESELSDIGLSIEKLRNTYHDMFMLLMKRTLDFHEKRYNILGGHLIYMSYKSFVHIYLRHVEELKFDNKYAEKDKFQLTEEDVFDVMDIVLHAVNDKYQEWREAHPNGRFCRTKENAYYYKGDYYNIVVEGDSQIVTFYKGTQSYENKRKKQ